MKRQTAASMLSFRATTLFDISASSATVVYDWQARRTGQHMTTCYLGSATILRVSHLRTWNNLKLKLLQYSSHLNEYNLKWIQFTLNDQFFSSDDLYVCHCTATEKKGGPRGLAIEWIEFQHGNESTRDTCWNFSTKNKNSKDESL